MPQSSRRQFFGLSAAGALGATMGSSGLARAANRPVAAPAGAREAGEANRRLGRMLGADMLLWSPNSQIEAYRHFDDIFAIRTCRKGPATTALPRGPELAITLDQGGRTWSADEIMQHEHMSGLLVMKDGKVLFERYAQGNTEHDRWTSMSMVKSYTSVMMGCAIKDKALAYADLDRPFNSYFADFKNTAYDDVTVRHMLRMSSGVKYDENYNDLACDVNLHYMKPVAERIPGYIHAHMATLPRLHAPGTQFHYSTGDVYLIGELISKLTGKTLAGYFSDKIWSRLGGEQDGFFILDSDNGMELAGSCASFTMRDYARFGQFILGGGVAGGVQVLPDGWLQESTTAQAPNFETSGFWAKGYGYYWWTNGDGTFQAIGFQGQMIYINPHQNIVIVTLSTTPRDVYRAPGDSGDPLFKAALIQQVNRLLA